MKKTFLALLGIIIVSTTLSGCSQEENTAEQAQNVENPAKIARFIIKEVEVFDLSSKQAQPYIVQDGSAKSDTTVLVMPQISGKITKLKAEVGQTVKKGQILATLGDSLATNSLDQQLKTAQESSNLSQNSITLTEQASKYAITSAELSSKAAYTSFQTALNAKKLGYEAYEQQVENAEIEQENAEEGEATAEDSLKNAKKAKKNLQNQLNNLKDDLSNLEDLNTDGSLNQQIATLEGQITAMEAQVISARSQVDAAEHALEIAENRVDQAGIAIQLLEENYAIQLNQQQSAIKSAYTQYKTALTQVESAKNAAKLQSNQAESQKLQTENSLKIARLNTEQKNISAPISGTVTNVIAEEGNFTSPGQAIMEIQAESIKITTSVSEKEATYITIGMYVQVSTDKTTVKGQVSNIAPTPNKMTKKIDLEIQITESTSIKSGELVTINFPLSITNKIFVPISTVQLRDDKKFVRTVSAQNKVELTEVTTGEIIANYIEIVSGLNGDEKVITTVNTFLDEGQRVTIK